MDRRTVNIVLSVLMILIILIWLIGGVAGITVTFEHVVVFGILLWVLRGL